MYLIYAFYGQQFRRINKFSLNESLKSTNVILTEKHLISCISTDYPSINSLINVLQHLKMH